MKKNISNRGFALILMLIMIMSLTSCSTAHDVGKSNIKKIVMDNLEEYYGGSFDIQSIEKKKIGVTAGGLRDTVYELEVYSKELDEFFSVRTQLDGSSMEDNYEQLKYEEPLNDEVYSINKNESGWVLSQLYIQQTTLTSEERCDSYEEYKASEKVSISLDIDVIGDDIDSIADTIYDYTSELCDHGFRLIITLYNDDEVVSLKDFNHNGNISRENIKDALLEIDIK